MTTQQLELPERARGQRERIKAHFLRHPNEDIPQPELNSIGAGDGVYCNSFTKRISEIRKDFRAQGGDLILSIDRINKQTGKRETWYRYMPIRDENLPTSKDIQEIYSKYA